MAVTKGDIKRDLRDIRHYYKSKSTLDYVGRTLGKTAAQNKAERYNALVCQADSVLYEFYMEYYISGNSYEAAAEEMDFSVGHLFRLNNRLVSFFYDVINEKNKENSYGEQRSPVKEKP